MKFYIIIITIFIFSFNIYTLEQSGTASWYGPKFHGKITANGEIFNTNNFTAAHKTLPFGSIVKVISLENQKFTIVRINDRGPFAKNRIIDLSMAAAKEISMLNKGVMRVEIIVLEKGNNHYHRYSKQKYMIQIASFENEDKAINLLKTLNDKNLDLKMKRVKLNKYYYRIIIDNINYSELQLYRVKLHKEGLKNYLVKKK